MGLKEPVYIQTLKGVKRIRKVSLGMRQELSTLLNEIFRQMTEFDTPEEGDISFSELYDKSDVFKAVCNEAVTACGLVPDELDIDTLFCLLLPHTADGGNTVRDSGILAMLNFPHTVVGRIPEKRKDTQGLESIIAMLWSVSGSLQDTLDSVYDDRIDAELLLKTLDELSKLKNPDEYFKRKAKQKAQDNILKNGFSVGGQWEEVEL